MRSLKRDQTAEVVIRGHAFVQNVRRGHYELGGDARCSHLRLAAAFDELVDRIACATETLLADVDDIDKAYALVKERAAAGASRTSLP